MGGAGSGAGRRGSQRVRRLLTLGAKGGVLASAGRRALPGVVEVIGWSSNVDGPLSTALAALPVAHEAAE